MKEESELKGKSLESLVAVGLFLAGWIFAQAVSLSSSMFQSLETVAVIFASVAAVGAAIVGFKVYKAWIKPVYYSELNVVLQSLEDEYASWDSLMNVLNVEIWLLEGRNGDLDKFNFDKVAKLMGELKTKMLQSQFKSLAINNENVKEIIDNRLEKYVSFVDQFNLAIRELNPNPDQSKFHIYSAEKLLSELKSLDGIILLNELKKGV
ncbi:hypothetical protein [Shewanella algae]|uniref:hypothetical protein n=1 Tax=Shewanella algae TaxID=38313 RepID=UPI0031F5A173